MRRFYTDPDELNKSEPRIKGNDARHMRTVLRMAAGDRVLLTDGTGRVCQARITAMEEQSVRVVIEKNLELKNESPLELVVAQGFLKDKKMDELLRHLTELGMTRWIPMVTQRTVARPDSGRMEKRIQRWESIAVEAIKQCGRTMVPAIDPLMNFSQVLDLYSSMDKSLFFWEEAKQPLDIDPDKKPASLLLVLGPEGGFTKDEARDASDKGFSIVSLGCRILRAETAAISACTLAQYLFGDLQKSP